MDAKGVKHKLWDFARAEFAKGKISWEEAGEIIDTADRIPDDLAGDKLMEKVKALDDNDKKLTPAVFKILGEWRHHG